MNLARAGNKYFNDSEPWKSVKTDNEKCSSTLNICLQTIYTLAEILNPVLPFSSEKIFKMLNTKKTIWDKCAEDNLATGHKLGKVEIIFPKIEDDIIEKQMQKLNKTEIKENIEGDDQITFEEFMKVKIKIGEVVAAAKLEKSDKLLKLIVKIGNEERQIIAGIAKSYKPEDLVNKKVVVVANLKPANILGKESQGMILAAEDEKGGLKVLSIDEMVKSGVRVK